MIRDNARVPPPGFPLGFSPFGVPPPWGPPPLGFPLGVSFGGTPPERGARFSDLGERPGRPVVPTWGAPEFIRFLMSLYEFP